MIKKIIRSGYYRLNYLKKKKKLSYPIFVGFFFIFSEGTPFSRGELEKVEGDE